MALNKTKTNATLGKEVREYLLQKGVETPIDESALAVPDAEKRKKIKDLTDQILTTLGLDLSDDSLMETSDRISKMFVDEIFWGLKSEYFPKATAVENKMRYDEMVIEKNISVKSSCEHHFAPIFGYATVAYIPKEKVLGLSKLNRIVEYFARRPQIQERLSEQIFHALCYILGTDDVAVVIDAEHFCVKSRGVEDVNSSTITSKLGGVFKDPTQPARAEFLAISRTSGK